MDILLSIGIPQVLWLLIGTVGIGICVMFVLGVFPQHRREMRRIRRAVRRQGADFLSAVEIPDGLDGRMFIDYLVLTPEAIQIVVIKRYEGLIYAGEKLDDWTQVVRQSNYRFPNPLKEMELKIIALRSIIPGIPIAGCVLFTESCKFPTRKPEGVIKLGDPVPVFEKRPIPEELQNAWRVLQSIGDG